jgi:hypothetical protein
MSYHRITLDQHLADLPPEVLRRIRHVSPAGLAAGEPVEAAAPVPAAEVEPFKLDLENGNIWLSGNKIPIIPALLSALVVKVVLFGGGKAASAAKGMFRRKTA